MDTQIKFSEFYDTELIGALQEIFDLAWQEINATPDYLGSRKDFNRRRNDLAQMIMLAHRSGLQPEEIRTALLEKPTGQWPAAAQKLAKKLATASP